MNASMLQKMMVWVRNYVGNCNTNVWRKSLDFYRDFDEGAPIEIPGDNLATSITSSKQVSPEHYDYTPTVSCV